MEKYALRYCMVEVYTKQKLNKIFKLDIVDFYPSISQKLQNATKFAKLHTKIDKQISEAFLRQENQFYSTRTNHE